MSDLISQYNTAYTIMRQAEQDIIEKTGMQVRLELKPQCPETVFKSPEQLLDTVAATLGMKRADYKKRTRYREYTELRFLATMLLFEYFPSISFKSIGRMFDQDHTSIIAGLERGKALLFGKDEIFSQKYNDVLAFIKALQKQS